MPELTVPDVDGLDTLSAALAYAGAGWYVGPLTNGSKHPGSRLGKNWQAQTSRDPEVIVSWFAGTDDGIFLHCGRSGAIVFDVDTPARLDGVLLQAIGDTQPPRQSTRTDVPGRGHYVFAQPPGRLLGNGLGKLPGGWGEIRGANGVIVAEPTTHEKAATGGQYKWTRTGPVPVLPEPVAELLHDSTPGLDAASDETVRAFLDAHTDQRRPRLLNVWASLFEEKVAGGESRHASMVSILTGAMAEARAGYYSARAAMDRLEALFLDSITRPGHGKQGDARTPGIAASEWAGIGAWAVAQAEAADLDDVRARVNQHVPDPDDTSWIPDEDGQEPATDPDTGEAITSPSMFFDRVDGLRALQLTKAVISTGPLGSDHGGNLYRYHDGVWKPDGEREIRARVAERLADRYRMGHASTVVDLLRNKQAMFDDNTVDTQHINLPNGLLDWRTGQIRPHTPDVPSTIRVPIRWDPDATCPAIDQWISEVFPDDARSFIDEIVGYCLLNDQPLHKAILLFGRGRNGKGTFLRLLRALLGARNVSSVTPQSLDENRYRAAQMYGKLANLVGDVDPRIFKATETFKQATGGDLLTAEHKYGQPFTFTCRATMVAAFNALPRSSDASEGFFSRWIVVPFTGYFPAGVADPSREDKLHSDTELQGLLVRAVAGLARLMGRGRFELPPSVTAESEHFRRVADPVRAFLDDYLPELDTDWKPRSLVYAAYVRWCDENGYQAMAAAGFYERIEAAGTDDDTSHGVHARTRNGTRGLLFTQKGAEGAADDGKSS